MKKEIVSFISMFILFTFLVLLPNISYAEEKELPFLSIADYTGPSAGNIVPCDRIMKEYFDYLNEKGGIEGIKIKFIGVDTRYDLARTVSAYKNYRKMPKLIFFHVSGSGMGRVIYPLAKRDGIAFAGTQVGHAVAKKDIWLCRGQVYQDVFGGTIDWIMKEWKKKGKPGVPTIGYMGWDSDSGWETMRGGKQYAEKAGIKLLDPVYYPPGSLDHSTYLLRLKGADYIYVESSEPEASTIIRTAYNLGLTKNTQFICDVWGPGTWGVRVYNEALQGLIIASDILRGVSAQSHPLIKELWAKYYPNQSIREFEYGAIFGLGVAMRHEAALRVALKEVSYDKLNKDVIYHAYQKLTGMDVTKGITGRCAYSATERRASKEMRLFQVKGQDVVPITDWFVAPDTVSLHKFE